MTISQTITDIPTPPSSSDAANFRTSADAFMASLDNLATELNTFITQANALETNVNAKEASTVLAYEAAVSSANFKGTWSSVTSYLLGESVEYSGITYRALQNSTNQTPSSAPTYWLPVSVASGIKNTPVGGISATDVQSALNELDTEKAPIDSPAFTGTPTAPNIAYKPTKVTITSWSYVTTTITLNVASHTFVAGDYIEVSGLTATTNIPNGVHLVTSVTATTIVFTYALTPTGTAGVSSASVKGYATTNGRTNGIGEGQTWQDVTASRAAGTTYTNTTGKTIQVYVSRDNVANSSWQFYINGKLTGHVNGYGTANGGLITVPNYATYIVTTSASNILVWSELR